jgi:hypothetical protein
MPTPEELATVREAILAGDPQKADDLLKAIIEKDSAATAAAAGKPAEPPPPRDPDVIVHAFMVAVADKFGNHQLLEDLANEFEHVLHLSKAH